MIIMKTVATVLMNRLRYFSVVSRMRFCQMISLGSGA